MEPSSVSRRKSPAIAYEAQVKIIQRLIDDTYETVKEFLWDSHEYETTVEKLKENEALGAMIRESIAEELEQMVYDLDPYYIISNGDIMKRAFKAEMKIWEKQRREAEIQAEKEEEAARKATEAELAQTGKHLAVPAQQAKRAAQYLRAQGIRVAVL